MTSLESRRDSILQRHRIEKQKRKTLSQWLWTKWVSFDSLIGGCIYDTNIEKFILYFVYTLVAGLVLWGLILQLRQVILLFIFFTERVLFQFTNSVQCSSSPDQ